VTNHAQLTAVCFLPEEQTSEMQIRVRLDVDIERLGIELGSMPIQQ
jgi:hypothetical protein